MVLFSTAFKSSQCSPGNDATALRGPPQCPLNSHALQSWFGRPLLFQGSTCSFRCWSLTFQRYVLQRGRASFSSLPSFYLTAPVCRSSRWSRSPSHWLWHLWSQPSEKGHFPSLLDPSHPELISTPQSNPDLGNQNRQGRGPGIPVPEWVFIPDRAGTQC